MTWEAVEVVGLPVTEMREVYPGIKAPIATGETIRKEPGDPITQKEFDAAGQTPEQIKSLVTAKAIKEKS